MLSSNVLFCLQPKDIKLTFIEEERNQKMFTFKKLESENNKMYLHSDFQNKTVEIKSTQHKLEWTQQSAHLCQGPTILFNSVKLNPISDKPC